MAEGFVPPQAVRNNAKRGLELRREHGRGGTEVGVARARSLSNGQSIPLETIRRMVSYFARHEVDKKGEGWGKDSAGYIAWLLWGGDAGRTWANGISEREKKKDKANMSNLTTAFFSIIKADRNADGTLMVYGKATDDSVDIDQQICDDVWLDAAMPEWFKSGGNIREQHSQIAAGVAKEYEKKKDGHYILTQVVDPISVKKVETGVLKGFSIGIKNPRVVRDTKAANGRIIDGQIVEVSLVDRPANPNCQLVLAKSVEGETGMWKVEELIEKEDKPNYEDINSGGGNSEPADKELYNRIKREAKRKFDVYPSAVANAWVVREYKSRGGKYKKKTEKTSNTLQLSTTSDKDTMTDLVKEIMDLSKSYNGNKLLKFDRQAYDSARQALATLIQVEAGEMGDGSNEEYSLQHLLSAVHHLFAWYEGEEQEGEVMEETMEMSLDKDSHIKSTVGCDCAGCESCGKAGGCDSKMCKEHDGKSMTKTDDEEPVDDEAEKSAKTHKCLECGCGTPQDNHGATTTNDFANVAKPSNVSTAQMVSPSETPKSAEGEETVAETPVTDTPVEETKTEETKENSEEEISADVEAIVEKAVQSATDSIRAEIASLVSAKEAVEAKAVSLESELAKAKSLVAGGGPKRTHKPADASNDLLTKANVYQAKANASTDPLLAKGYKELAKEFLAKATTPDAN